MDENAKEALELLTLAYRKLLLTHASAALTKQVRDALDLAIEELDTSSE
jgi:hypothetical protein